MPKTQISRKRQIPSLYSLSAEKVALNLPLYVDWLSYLPVQLKATLLKKLLRSPKLWRNLPVNQTFNALVHPSLKQIDLSAIYVDDGTLDLLTGCRELTHLVLRDYESHKVSEDGLKKLFVHLSKLIVLDVSYCKQFNDAVLETLAVHCRNLHEFCAEGCNITNSGFAFLAQNNKRVRCLTISNTKVDGVGISNAVTNKNWSSLQELRLDNCEKVNDEVLKTIIQNCPKIEILTFFNCAITDETSIFQDITTTCKKLKQIHWTITW